MMLTLAQARSLLLGRASGSVLVGDGATPLLRVHSDTRTLRAGDLFVALRGERFDAHDFLPQARTAGAVAALAEHGLAEAGLPGLIVPDALAALQQLAAAWRQRYTGPLIAITGSNGKTTVTQMVAAILRAWLGEGPDSAALATAGNLNNHIGVPLTLLRLRPAASDAGPAHRAAVLELGMNHPGEIALLAALAQPTVALVNNAQREHQEFMAGVDAVARENGSVVKALGDDGTAVLPLADPCLPLWRSLAGERRVWTFGATASLDAAAGHDPMTHVAAVARPDPADPAGAGWLLQLYTPQGGADTTLALAGWHNVANAAAAAACALAAGAPLAAVARGLAAFRPVAGRMQTLQLQRDGRALTLVDDSYNANPDSVLAAIDVLAGLPGPRWLVMGDMGEVGTQGPQFHAEVGEHARRHGIEHVWTAGALCAHAAATRHFADVPALLVALATAGEAPAAASVLVKGSRFMKMERVVQAMLQAPGQGSGATAALAASTEGGTAAGAAAAAATEQQGAAHAA
jgi:UDP-N-acetylmuramoyl-tripeptide--D-alanyl-D-alanine ligase